MSERESPSIDETESGWTSCPPGEISGAVRQFLAREHRLVWQNVGSLAVIAVATVFCSYVVVSRLAEQSGAVVPTDVHNRMTCRQARQMLESYIAGSLDSDLAERLRVHLKKCPSCQQEYEDRLARTGCSKKKTDPRMALTGADGTVTRGWR